MRVPVDYILNGFQQLLLGMPAPVAIIVFALIAWQISGVGMGVATLVSLIAIGAIGAWSQAMVTLALVFAGKANPKTRLRELPGERVMVG